MPDEKKLYPLRFLEIEDKYAWGTDSFKIADLGYRDTVVADGWLAANTLSEVMDTYMDRVVGDNVFAEYGRLFPVQVKRIRCHGRMPLRVHPGDEIAAQRYDSLGREKLWYVVKASSDARLFLGWNRPIDAGLLIDGIKDGTLPDLLNEVAPKAGEFYHIRPGVVHGASGEVEIIEVSESSALDFCVFPWGQPVSAEEFDETFSVIDALDFIDYAGYVREGSPAKSKDGIRVLADYPQFTARKIDLADPLRISGGDPNSFAVYLCLYGKAAVQAEIEGIGPAEYRLDGGSAILVPAEVEEFILTPMEQTTSVLEVFCECKPVNDTYNDGEGE